MMKLMMGDNGGMGFFWIVWFKIVKRKLRESERRVFFHGILMGNTVLLGE